MSRILSRSGQFRRAGTTYGISSDRGVAAVAGRKARHDQVAMFLLRKDFASAMPARRALRVAGRRRVLVLLVVFVSLWWVAGRLLL